MVNPLWITLGVAAIFLAGLTNGVSGFGFALVAVPLLILYLPPKVVVPLVTIHSAITGSVVLYEARKWLQLQKTWPLLLAGTLGVPPGSYLLTHLDVRTFKVYGGVTITLAALAFLFGFRRPIRNERQAYGPVGLLGGLLNGSTGMGGPPVILFLTNQGMEKRIFRASLAAYFLSMNLIALPTYAWEGLLTRTVAIYAALYLPALALGLALGIRLARVVEEQAFRRLTLLVVLAAGLISMAQGFGLL